MIRRGTVTTSVAHKIVWYVPLIPFLLEASGDSRPFLSDGIGERCSGVVLELVATLVGPIDSNGK